MLPSIVSSRSTAEAERLRNRRAEADNAIATKEARVQDQWARNWCQIPLSSQHTAAAAARHPTPPRAAIATNAREWRIDATALRPVLLPTTGAAPVGAAARPAYVRDAMNALATPALFGLSRARLVWTAHCVCAVVHLIMAIIVLSVAYGADNQYLRMYRQRFLFTVPPNNTESCGALNTEDFANATARPIAILVDNGLPLHLGWAAASFSLLSVAAHSVWVCTAFSPRLYDFLFSNLVDAFVPSRHARLSNHKDPVSQTLTRSVRPERWIEYAFSSSVMFMILQILAGIGRNEAVSASGFVLMAVTMFHGYFTELLSRPDPASGGTRWTGQRVDGFDLQNYVWRMHPHILGTIPYFSAWIICYKAYNDILDDIRERFTEVGDLLPAFLVAAFIAVFVTFSLFSFCQMWYQARAPQHYWRTEIVYCALSLTSKMILSILLLVNVLVLGNAEEGSAGG